MLHSRGITVTTMLAVLLMAGCTLQDEPEPPPVASSPSETAPEPSPTPTPTPTETPVAAPEPPPELERTDEVGAAAAAEYFLELYGYVMQTGDVTQWDAMTFETCQFCGRTRNLAVSINEAGEAFTGSVITPGSTFVHPFDDLIGAYPVDVDFTQSPSEHRGANGELINISEPGSGTLGIDMKLFDDGWRVLAVTAQDE